ncbi:MAG TPA: multidrug ABC transporter permease [Bacteroidetes bacterium]|nr:multidrug ABC transporter permease [Bacteroidota bacterium]
MRIPLVYSVRNLFTRKLTASLTILGVALVVFVFAAVLMLAYGVEKTLVATGSDDNVIMLRKGSDTELVSGIDRDQMNTIRALSAIDKGQDGKPLASSEVVTIINLQKISTNDMGNITVRGVSPEAFMLRPVVRLTSGRMYAQGARELIAGANISKRFKGAQIGQTIKFSGDTWTIVGLFDANGTGFDSEVWGDADQLMGALNRRGAFSSVTIRMKDKNDFAGLQKAMEADNRLKTLKAEREKEYYERQSRFMAIFIRVLGLVITIGFSVGAIIGAMITMYAAVANRTVEIGTLRALGFQRTSILITFLLESIFLSLAGGLIGLVIASGLQFFTISTVNFGTFAELAFSFTLSANIVIYSLIFAVVMGFVGGFLPAARAARLNVLDALRAS